MDHRQNFRFLTLLLGILLHGLIQQAFAVEATEGEKLFALKIKPLFAEKCNACHGDEPDKIKGGLDLRTRDSLLSGGEAFADEVLIPGKGKDSFLYITTTRSEEDYEMPPKEADQLTPEQQWWIRDWIDEGAPWPDDQRVAAIQDQYAEGMQVVTSKALSEDWQSRRYDSEKLWAYKPLQVKPVPSGQNPIDYFVDQKLQEIGLKPAGVADAVALVRRLAYNLTGLPPTPEQVASFTEDYQDDVGSAVLNLAEQLMSSMHYGERFGAHWLDVVRYADTAGYANDYYRPNAWRYRDYVIRSFNQDKPYNEFVRQQIAGDLLGQRNPEDLIATGFLRMGPWEHTGMSVFAEMRQKWLDDITDSVGQTFLAHALQCAKCHDHKFDPVPTRDYYSMMAVFSTTQFAERSAPFLDSENKTGFAERVQWVNAKRSYYSDQYKQLNQKVAKLRKTESGAAKVGENGLDPGDEASQSRINKNLMRHKVELDMVQPFALSVFQGATVPVKNANPISRVAKNPWQNKEVPTDHILTGGDVYTKGDVVDPAPLSAAVSLGGMQVPSFPAKRGPRRLALADWIVDERNPLTARVMVNRIWSWHFGRGIAGNPNNFGGTGALPTHPELLDYLADYFMENDWSVKTLNRLILSSKTWRRSTQHPLPDIYRQKDPVQKFYGAYEMRRLTAEELRDSFLAISGELNRQFGGIPARPDLNPEVAFQPRQLMGGAASVYEADPLPEQRNRRSIYAERNRGLRDSFLESFNQPGLDTSCELRETSTIAPQALTLFNAEEVLDRALAFANRLIKGNSKESDEFLIDRAFQLTFGRKPDAEETQLCLSEWHSATKRESLMQPEEKKFSTTLKRTVMAEKTGEPYDFIEHVPTYESYQPDLQRADVDARVRGLSHVCRVLFNANEFVYLD